MGFAKYFEDIEKARFESSIAPERMHIGGGPNRSKAKKKIYAVQQDGRAQLAKTVESWRNYLGEKPEVRVVKEAAAVLTDPFAYPKGLISKFWDYYQRRSPIPADTGGKWEPHLANLSRLHSILRPLEIIGNDHDPDKSWDQLKALEAKVRGFFAQVTTYGPLSRQSVKRMRGDTNDILTRCKQVQSDLDHFERLAESLPPAAGRLRLQDDLEKLRQIQGQLTTDLTSLARCDDLTDEVEALWNRFLLLSSSLPVQRHYRPKLHELNRLRLNESQEAIVAMNYDGWHRVQGTSGSGKTLIIIHRALRLAIENPKQQVRVFTINRSLTEHLRATATAIHGRNLPPNLSFSCIYDFFLGILDIYEHMNQYRLREPLSTERSANTWRMFFNHRGTNRKHNVFADEGVKRLLISIEKQGNSLISAGTFDRQAAGRYLRDEMVYIQSAYSRSTWTQYLSDHRVGRCLQLKSDQRNSCLVVLNAWEEWLEAGGLCDIYGVSTKAAFYINEVHLGRIRKKFPTSHILIDEVQDVSSLELRLVRNMIVDPMQRNSFMFAGDTNQKVYVKHHNMASAGFPMAGRVSRLPQNYRNTKQILRAAWCVAEAYPPQVDDVVELFPPDLSVYDGGIPVALCCPPHDHERVLLNLICWRSANRVAVITENENLLNKVRTGLKALKLPFVELLRNDDLDRWGESNKAPLIAKLVIGRLDAVKGYEFDTVIVADLSAGVVPAPTLPHEEYWREAAVAYSALTRARDELILTYTGQPSVFLSKMEHKLRFEIITDQGDQMKSLLGTVTASSVKNQ